MKLNERQKYYKYMFDTYRIYYLFKIRPRKRLCFSGPNTLSTKILKSAGITFNSRFCGNFGSHRVNCNTILSDVSFNYKNYVIDTFSGHLFIKKDSTVSYSIMFSQMRTFNEGDIDITHHESTPDTDEYMDEIEDSIKKLLKDELTEEEYFQKSLVIEDYQLIMDAVLYLKKLFKNKIPKILTISQIYQSTL